MDYNNFLKDIINKRTRLIRRYLILAIISIVLTLSVFIVSCFFIKDKTIIYLSIINVLLFIIAFSFAYYAFRGIIIPLNKQNKIFNKILDASDKDVVGKVINIKNNVTIDNGVTCNEITVLINEQEMVLTLFDEFNITLIENNDYTFKIRLNYLIGVEDEK